MSETKTLDVELFDKYTKEWHCCGNSAKARITIMRSGPGSEDDFYEHKDALIRELVREAVRRSAAQLTAECCLANEVVQSQEQRNIANAFAENARQRILAQIGE